MKNNISQHQLNRTGARVSSPSSGVRPGARALNLELPTSFGLRLFMGALCLLAGSLFFGHSACAASYLNVSSSGSVSFGSIRPTSSGTSSTGSDTLTVHTDCSVGYSVYVSGQNGKDTNLTNSSVPSNNTISTSSNAIGSAGSLSVNTWGLNYENNGTYVGLPEYSETLPPALVTIPSAAETSTVDIYYGLKVNTALTPGTYTGDILYTVLANSACSVYTVRFNANGGTGTMADQTINVGEATNLSANAFIRSGYTFLGWSTDSSATTATYADKQSVADLTDFNTTIDLYAIWAPISGNMQDWTGCSSLAASQQIYLQDVRDNKVYSVKKLPDSKCWMTQNLALGMSATETGLTLSPSNTNIDNGATYYLPPAGKQGSSTIDDPSTLTAIDVANFDNDASVDQHAKTKFRTKATSIINDSDTGYYNFYTVTLGFSYYNDSITAGVSPRDICPRGWRLPKANATATATSGTQNFTGDFAVLAVSYNTNATWSSNGLTSTVRYTDDPTIYSSLITSAAESDNSYAGFSPSGYRSRLGGTSGLGQNGYYRTSSVSSAVDGNLLYYNSSNIYPQRTDGKFLGFAARCLAQNRYTINYNVNGASGVASKSTEGALYENSSITTATVGTMTKTGHHFLGWSTDGSAATATYQPGASISVSALATAASAADGGTITLYAIWSPNTYTIAYNGNGSTSGSTASQTNQTYGSNVTLQANGFTRTNYTFLGWSTSSSATTSSYFASTSYAVSALADAAGMADTNDATINLYAVWKTTNNDPLCSSSLRPTASVGCQMADGNTWIYGNSEKEISWYSLCTSSNNCKSSTYCPRGYSIPASSIYSLLISTQGSGSLRTILNVRAFWSSTENTGYTYDGYFLSTYYGRIDSNSKSHEYYVLCYKRP